jgi:hypothetical protein
MTIPASNRFLVYLGSEPHFFVPDTGTPGALVTWVQPDGTENPVEPEFAQTDPVPESKKRPGQPGIVGRLSIRTRRQFKQPGVHLFRIVQDAATTEYEFTVIAQARYGDVEDQRREVLERKAWHRMCSELPQTNENTPQFAA